MRRLTLEEKIWRYNYQERVYAGIIPKRNTYEKNNMDNLSTLQYTATLTKTVVDIFFNKDTGLFEAKERVIRNIQSQHDLYPRFMHSDGYELIMAATELPLPPSERALPPAVKVSKEQRDKFLDFCPSYMNAYKEKLIKSDGSW